MRLREAVCLGLGLAFLQACAVECIYIYVKGHKACGPLQGPVVVVDREGKMIELTEEGAPPAGCVCLDHDLESVLEDDPDSAELDQLYADLEAAAQERCVELAMLASADPAPCELAVLNKGEVTKSAETYESCKYLGATIDEDKDGYCPIPPGEEDPAGGDEAGETGTDTGGTDTGTDGTDTGPGGPIVPDLPLEFP